MTVGVLFCSAIVLAQEAKPELAPFPLEIIRTPADCTTKDREELQMLLPMMLRAADAAVPDSAKLSAALANLGGQNCNRDDACLAQLGKQAGSLYAFYAQLDFDLDGNVVASGRVVRDDGKAVREPKTVKVPRGTAAFRDAAQVALNELLVSLDVAHLSPFRPKEKLVESTPVVSPEPKLTPTPVADPVEVASTSSSMTIPALAIAGVGAVGLVVGGVLFANAGSVRTEVRDGVVRVFGEDASKVAGIQRSQTAGVALLAVGAGLAAVGAGLYAFGPSETATAVVPINGGAAVVMTGSLP